MIVLFHGLTFLFKFLIDLRKKQHAAKEYQKLQQIIQEVEVQRSLAYKDAENNLKFDPPVYRQRYGRVYEVLLNDRWKKGINKIVEFGCSELSLFVFLKSLVHVNEICFVDIDEDVLKENLFKLQPLTIDYVKSRNSKLTLNVFVGSISDPDQRLLNTDAVIGIEIIEHLYPDVLEAVPFNVFHNIRPKIAIFTTPNADFNCLLPNFKKFRHRDHKFEWTREQFEEWGRNVTQRFPDYLVNFEGIGCGPEGTEIFGCCSQMAVFVRKDVIDPYSTLGYQRFLCNGDCGDSKLNSVNCTRRLEKSFGICEYFSYSRQIMNFIDYHENSPDYFMFYKPLQEIIYPYDVDNRTPEEILWHDIFYHLCILSYRRGRFFNEQNNRSEIPLSEFLAKPSIEGASLSEVKTLLESHNYKVEECQVKFTKEKELCVIHEAEMERSQSPTSESGASGYESEHTKYHSDASYSDWDEDSPRKMDFDKKGKDALEKVIRSDVDSEESKKQKKSFFESGCQKSLPSIDDSSATQEISDHVFNSCGNITENIAKNKLKGKVVKDPSAETSTLEKTKMKIDSNKFNELDSFSNQNQYYHFPCTKTFVNHVVKPQTESKKVSQKEGKDPVAGPSNVKKKKKLKKVPSENEIDNFEEVKSIANCLLENTLNKLNIVDDLEHELIEIESEPIIEIIDESPDQIFSVVENEEFSNNTNLEEADDLVLPLVENVNNNDTVEGDVAEEKVVDEPVPQFNKDLNVLQENASANGDIDPGVARASQEALFDPNSQVDLLEDFEIPPLFSDYDTSQTSRSGNEALAVIGVNVNIQDSESVVPTQTNGFPDWLLQILGANIIGEDGEPHDEPHFYCQGDGLGVHPSVIAVDVEEDDEASSESSSSTNGSADFTDLDNASSEPNIELENVSEQSPEAVNNETSTSVNISTSTPETVSLPHSNSATHSDSEEFFDSSDEMTNNFHNVNTKNKK